MAVLHAFIAFALIFAGCDKEVVTFDYQEIELDSFIVENYSNDARQLYFHEIIQDSTHVNYNNPVIDNDEVEKILKIIQAVYDSNSPERDTVFEIYNIHGYYCYSFSHIHLKVDTELPEIQNLAQNKIPTGEPQLDDILNAYHFDSVVTFRTYPDFQWLTLYSKNEYNMIPVERELESLESVQAASFNKGCIGDGNTIHLTRNSDSAIITFSIGRGDCPAGCITTNSGSFGLQRGRLNLVELTDRILI